MPPTVLTSGLGSWGRWCLGRTRTPTAGKEGGPMQHEGNHVNFESYFQLGRAETAGWWSFPPFLRVWSMCKSEPGLHISSFLPQNSLEKSSCCSPAREDLACHLSLPDSQSPPLYLATRILLFPLARGRLPISERCWHIQGAGYRRDGSAAAPSSGRDIPGVSWPVERLGMVRDTRTQHRDFYCAAVSLSYRKLQSN